MLEVMEKFGWTYDEYMNQPIWILQYAHEKIKQENKVRRKKQKEANR